jgi:hypothetical protein
MMAILALRSANALAARFEIEPFADVPFLELNPIHFETMRLRVEKAVAQVRGLGPQLTAEVQEVL